MEIAFSLFAATSPDALVEIDQNGRIIYANQIFDDMFRPERDTNNKSVLADLEIPEPLMADLQRGIDLAISRNREEQLKSKTICHGEHKHWDCRIVPIPCQELGKAIVEIRDVTESKKLRNALLTKKLNRHQEEYLKERRRSLFFGLLDNFPTFVYLQRRDHTVAFANKKVRELYGETRDRRCFEVFAGRSEPCPVCPTFEVFDTGLPTEWEFSDNDGRTFLIYDYPYEDDSGESLVMELGIDVTDLKRVEKELFRAQKLRAIGVLAGGIAHDLNNNLVPIIFNIEYALNKVNDQKICEPLSEGLQAAYRAGSLVRQVLEYSRQQDVSRDSIHLTPLVRENIYELKATLDDVVSIDFEQNASQDSIFANHAQIQQVTHNLLKNAIQSMPEGGVITVTIAEEEVTSQSERLSREIASGHYVTLSVKDSGVGIRPENMDRIFEPFFTSKKATGGTGMGLAVVHSIVTGSGGHIMVDSVPGIETTFKIYFPKVAPSDEPLQGELCVVQGENTRLLLVDDDLGSLSAMARSLRQAGFEIETARSGEEGLEIYSNNPNSFNLILADQSMPGMTGLQMSKKILDIDRDARIVICTGHIEPSLEEQAKKEGVIGFARKPMTPNALIETVKQHCRYV